tara:strand:+ start:6136 stop:6519 length:384 start_codon:yes stop_codon:yes gene_type:complete
MHTLSGKVKQGLDKSKYFMSLGGYEKQLEEFLGAKPFPGTLNLVVDPEKKDGFLNELEPITIEGFHHEGKFYNKVTCYKATIQDIPCLILIPKQTSHGSDILEIIAEHNLREKLNLEDYTEVTITAQ